MSHCDMESSEHGIGQPPSSTYVYILPFGSLTLRQTFFLKDLEEGFSLFNLVFIDSFLFRYFQMNTHEDQYYVCCIAIIIETNPAG